MGALMKVAFLGFWVLGFRFYVLGTGYWVFDFGLYVCERVVMARPRNQTGFE